jgi:hypothetical protein
MALTQVAGGMIASGQTITSPTLVTPALGTPASGVMTNVTGIPAAQLTGQVPAANATSGSIVQVVTGSTSTNVTNSTSTFVDTGITATITPKFSTSRILVLISILGLFKSSGNSNNRIGIQLQRNGSVLDQSLANLWTQTAVDARQSSVYNYTDTPASTSALTYKLQFCNEQNVAEARFQRDSNSGTSSIMLLEVAA